MNKTSNPKFAFCSFQQSCTYYHAVSEWKYMAKPKSHFRDTESSKRIQQEYLLQSREVVSAVPLLPLGLAHPCPCLQSHFYYAAQARWKDCIPECCSWWGVGSGPPSAAGVERQGNWESFPHPSYWITEEGHDLLSHPYHPQRQHAYAPSNKVSSIMLSRWGVAPSLLSASVAEGWDQVSIVLFYPLPLTACYR